MPWINRTTLNFPNHTDLRYEHLTSRVEKLDLLHLDYTNNGNTDWVVTATLKTPTVYQELKAALQSSGLTPPTISCQANYKRITLSSNHLATLATFINSIKSMADDFAEIEPEIHQKLETNFNQAYPVPVMNASPAERMSSAFSTYLGSNRPITTFLYDMIIEDEWFEDQVVGSSYAMRHPIRHEQLNVQQREAPAHTSSNVSAEGSSSAMWTKSGILNNNPTYTNPRSAICELNIYIGLDKNLVSVMSKTEADYQILKNRLQIAGFIPPVIELNDQTRKVELLSSSHTAITNFLKVIKAIALNFDEIEPEISQKLGIDLSHNNINPHWFPNKSGLDNWHYYNTNTSSVVSQIQLNSHFGRIAFIAIKTATAAHFQTLQATLLNAGCSPDSLTHESNNKKIVFKSRNRTAITDFMKVIKTLSLNFDDIEQEVSQRLEIDLNQAYAAPQPIWTKEGDFSRRINSGGTLIHNCNYRDNSTSAISDLHLCQYNDGEYKIWFTATNNAQHQILAQQMVRAGFPAPSRWSSNIELITKDKRIMANFFNVLKQNVPEFSDIEQEISGALGINLNESSVIMPTWLKQFDFNTRLDRSYAPMARHVSYKTGNTQSAITEFDLYGYVDNEFMFVVSLSEQSNPLKQALTTSGLPLSFDNNGQYVRLRFNANSHENFNHLTTILSQHSSHFSEIVDNFKQHVTPIITTTSSHRQGVSGLGLFSGETANVSSISKNNEQKLEDIGFSEFNLSDIDRENFKRYCCSISKSIMTEPVQDPELPAYQFEKSEILRWLAIKRENPCNRAPLTPEKLTPNTELKQEIDTFVNALICAHEQKIASGRST